MICPNCQSCSMLNFHENIYRKDGGKQRLSSGKVAEVEMAVQDRLNYIRFFGFCRDSRDI